jgi:galactose mutarotase-like enzyme
MEPPARQPQTETATFDGERAYVLRAGDGTEAWVLPSIGANCIALSVPLPPDGAPSSGQKGGTAHLLSTPPSAAALRGHPTGSGFPILSPHPSGGRAPFLWRGRSYAPPGGRERLAGHGFAAGAPWEVLHTEPDSLVCRLDTRTLDPATAWWPWPFTLTATHRVQPAALTLSLELESLHPDPAPVMLGLHPYHPLRLVTRSELGPQGRQTPPTAADLVAEGEAEARQACRVWVEGGDLWDLDRARSGWGASELQERWALRRPRSLADLAQTAQRSRVAQADGRMPVLFYGDQEALRGAASGEDPAAPGGITSGVVDTASGVALRLETSRAFGAVVVYTPPAHAAVSLEPRSTLLDALTVGAAQPDLPTGVRSVAPGRPWRAWVRLSLQPAAGA